MISKDREITYHKKGWGLERWIDNNELYCGKLLTVFKGLFCSVHYHKLKTETFFIQSGLITMRVWEKPFVAEDIDIVNVKEFVMEPGDRLVIPPNTPHQFGGILSESVILEISTQHFEADSVRIIKGD